MEQPQNHTTDGHSSRELLQVACTRREKSGRAGRVNAPGIWGRNRASGHRHKVRRYSGETMLNKGYAEWYYVNNSPPQ